MALRDKACFPPPFSQLGSPVKGGKSGGGGGGGIAHDPAFEFEAPMYCELHNDNYDFYDDYEKNVWFQTTHWLHEPPEKRPVDKTKRKSMATAGFMTKRNQLTDSASPAKPKPSRGGSTEATTTRKSGDVLDQDSPSRVFAPLSDNVGDVGEYKRAKFGVMGSPMSKLKGPERIPRDEGNKENIPESLDTKEEPEETIPKPKSRKSVMPRTSNEGKSKITETKTGRTSDGLVKEDKKPALKGRTSGGKDTANTLKGNEGAEGKMKSRASGEITTTARGDSKVAESLKERKSSGKEEAVASSKVVQKSKSEGDIKKRKSTSGEGILQPVSQPEAPTSRSTSSIQAAKIKSRRSMMPTSLVTEKILSTDADKPTKIKPRKSISTTALGKAPSTSIESATQPPKPKPRKSVATSGLSFLNTHSTSITTNIPCKIPSPSSSSSSSPPPSTTSQTTPNILQSTIPFLDNLRVVSSLPTRVKVGEEDDQDDDGDDRQPEEQVVVKETEKEKEKRKRKSADTLASDKPKRVRSSIMACPVPAKKLVPPTEVPAKAPAAQTQVPSAKSKRKAYEFDLDDDVAAILEKHNKKFKPVASYVPRNFSTKDVKTYEEFSGKKWYSLNAAEREAANDWIKQMKAQMQ